MHLDYTIRFDQPWRIGSGEAAGPFLDERVRRDGFGLPFLPGTTLQGLVVDAVRRLCRLLDVTTCAGTLEREPGGGLLRDLCGVNRQDRCPVCALAGSPHREGLARFGAAEALLSAGGRPVEDPEDRRRVAGEAGAVSGLLARSHPHTAIDPRTGRAADEKLFSLEEASDELRLIGRIELGPGLTRRDLSLLVGALRFIREAGGGRRRGLGGCRIEIDQAALDPAFASWQEAVRHLGSLRGGGEAGGAITGAGSAPPDPTRAPAGTTVLQLDAVVRGEVVVGGRPEAGNLIAGLAYLPGSSLRGALAAGWSGDREDEEFGRCFLAGAIRFGFLLPVEGETAALPVPLSLHTCKLRPGPPGAGHGFVDLLGEPDREECREPDCHGLLVPWGPRFGRPKTATSPTLLLSPHNRIEFEDQTVKEASLFAYEALPAGTRLRGYLRAESDQDLDLLLAGTGIAAGRPFTLRVGRRKGTLGWLECTLRPYPGEDGGVGLFPDAERLPERLRESAGVRIDLVTPAIVLDEHLRFREALTPEMFGVPRPGFDQAFAATAVVAGWNAAHRLPKPDQIAVAAGSSFLLLGVSDSELTALRECAAGGIGIRRAEGFGAFTLRPLPAVEPR